VHWRAIDRAASGTTGGDTANGLTTDDEAPERSAYGIVLDLAEAGYILKERAGHRNRYQIQARLPLPEPSSRERTASQKIVLAGGKYMAQGTVKRF
jgi:hypothetical protein